MFEHDNNCFNLVCVDLFKPVGMLSIKKRNHFDDNMILTKEEFQVFYSQCSLRLIVSIYFFVAIRWWYSTEFSDMTWSAANKTTKTQA